MENMPCTCETCHTVDTPCESSKKCSDEIAKMHNNLKKTEQKRQLKYEAKISKAQHKFEKKQKMSVIKKSKSSTSTSNKWYNFFTKWFFIGIILILFSIIGSLVIDKYESNYDLEIMFTTLKIISDILSSVGIAMLIGCVFDFSKNSEAFMDLITKILHDIVVSKNFLSELCEDGKEEALKLILQPSDKQIEQYSNINEYFKKQIKESMNMFNTNFKANLILNVEARKDSNGKVYCETTATYTIYKLSNKFNTIKAYCEKEGSSASDVRIISPLGDKLIERPEPTKETIDGIEYLVFSYNIPEDCEQFDHLTIKRTMTEPGNQHWINYYWQSLSPYDGLTCRISCFDDLSIKDYMIFDNKAYYKVELTNDKTRIEITSAQWLAADTGFCVSINDYEEL